MNRHRDDDFDDEEDSFADEDADGDSETIPCPYCGASIYEDAIHCPRCDRYLSDEDRTATHQPRWVIITAVVLLAALAIAFLR